MYVYLASPYSSDPETNFARTLEFVAEEMRKGTIIFSPIAHCHPIAEAYDMPGDFAFWKKYNMEMLAPAGALWVLKLPGWETSIGVTAEIEYATQTQKPIFYIEA